MPAKQKPNLARKSADCPADYVALVESIKDIARGLQSLNRQVVREYTPVVESILRSHSRDTNHIDHTLDVLLSFCGYAPDGGDA